MWCKRNFCEGFTAWRFTTKCAYVKVVKPWILSHYASESLDISKVGSATSPERTWKDWRVLEDISTERIKGRPRTRWRNNISEALLSSFCCGANWTIGYCWKQWGISFLPGASVLVTLPRCCENEWLNELNDKYTSLASFPCREVSRGLASFFSKLLHSHVNTSMWTQASLFRK